MNTLSSATDPITGIITLIILYLGFKVIPPFRPLASGLESSIAIVCKGIFFLIKELFSACFKLLSFLFEIATSLIQFLAETRLGKIILLLLFLSLGVSLYRTYKHLPSPFKKDFYEKRKPYSPPRRHYYT